MRRQYYPRLELEKVEGFTFNHKMTSYLLGRNVFSCHLVGIISSQCAVGGEGGVDDIISNFIFCEITP